MNFAVSIRRAPLAWLGLALSGLSLLACAGTQVRRAGLDEPLDLSGHWNDTDSRLVAAEMIRDALGRNWDEDFDTARGSKPAVIVGGVRNLSHEHLNTRTFVADLERAWLDSGRVTLVASSSQRGNLRAERTDQARHASLETAKSMGKELGADFMLLGQIDSILDEADGETVRYYQVELELIDLESNVKTWIGQKKIRKVVSRSRFKF